MSNFGHQRSTQQELHPDKFTAHNTLQNGRIDGVPDNTEFNLLNNTGSKNTVSYPTKPNSSTPVNPSALDCRKNLVSTCSQTLSSPALMTPANVTSSSQSPGSQLNQSMTSSMAEGGAMTSVCHICESPVSRSAGALLAMGRLLHNDCYICCKCGRQPKVGQEVAIESKKVRFHQIFFYTSIQNFLFHLTRPLLSKFQSLSSCLFTVRFFELWHFKTNTSLLFENSEITFLS